jgi:hypothetical protein
VRGGLTAGQLSADCGSGGLARKPAEPSLASERSSRCGQMRCAASFTCVVGILLIGVSTAAQPTASKDEPRVRFVYSVDPEAANCPDEPSMRAMVTQRLGYDPFSPQAAPLVMARIRVANRTLQGEVESIRGSGTSQGRREVTSEHGDCAALASSLALAIAIAIDPLSLTRPAASASSSPAPQPSAPLPEASSAPAKPPAPARQSVVPAVSAAPPAGPRYSAALTFIGSTGTLPGFAWGGALYLGARWLTWSVGLEGRLFAPSDVQGEGVVSARASFYQGALVPCFHPGAAMACATGSVGVLDAQGQGVDVPRSDKTAVGLAGLRGGYDFVLGRGIFLRALADLQVPLTKITLQINGQPLWTAPPVAIGGGLGVGGTIP